MLVLFETPAGFKITDENKLKNAEEVASLFQTPEKARKL